MSFSSDMLTVSAKERISTIQIKFSTDIFAPVSFAHGFQTWNISRARHATEQRRKKSLGSKLGYAGMFHDTDAPTWQRSDAGVESHGFCLLSDKEHTSFVILGATTCKRAASCFWIGRDEILWYMDWGNDGAKGSLSEGIFVARGNNAVELIEAFADAAAFAADQIVEEELKLKSPLRDLGRPPVGWGG